MTTELDAAVARLKDEARDDIDPDHFPTPTFDRYVASADLRLVLAELERRGADTAELRKILVESKYAFKKASAERDAARAEVERERREWASVVDACAQVGIVFAVREPTPEHPVGVEVRNEAALELARLREEHSALARTVIASAEGRARSDAARDARLRERDARVLRLLGLVFCSAHGAPWASTETCRLCDSVREAIAILQETL